MLRAVPSKTALLTLVWLSACASGLVWRKGEHESGRALHVFTNKQELMRLATRPQAPLELSTIQMQSWQLELPTQVPASATQTLRPLIAPGAHAQPALDCVAHELGRVMLPNPKQQPSLSLRYFIAARCQAVVGLPEFQVWRVPAGRDIADDTLLAELRSVLEKSPPVAALATQFGAAIARDDRSVVIIASYSTPRVELEPFDPVIARDTTFHIAGRVLVPGDGAVVSMNSGATSVVHCTLDPAFALPRFAFSCPLAPGDDHAWVQMSLIEHGRVLQSEVLSLFALRHAQAATLYQAPRLAETKPFADNVEFSGGVLQLLNTLRAHDRLRPLTAAPAQTRMANQLAPALLYDLSMHDGSHASNFDRIVLGLLAGWDVTGGTIREANLAMNLTVDSMDAARWLADALERPSARAVLLDPDADVLAVGAFVQKQPSVVAGLALTYAFFKDETHSGDDARRVVERLTRLRTARKLGRTRIIKDPPSLAQELPRVRRGELLPSAALENLMEDMVAATHRHVRGVLWETHDLEELEFPKELLVPGDLAIAAGATYYRPPGSAWGQYCVLFAVMDLAQSNTH